ncbi:MAG: glycoside hydrolase family 172 protein [Promethearchaeota archaeon]
MKPIGFSSSLDELSRRGDIPWRAIQVSTHGHDRVVEANILMPQWREFEAKGLKHRDNVRIAPCSTFEFPAMTGPGTITNIWFTFMPYKMRKIARYEKYWEARKKIRLQIYFDEESEPSVDCPIGDFFGVGFGEYKVYQSKYLEETSGGYICRFPMPFKKSARVCIKNTSEKGECSAFYGAITYRQYDEPFTSEPYYFHARYREEVPTQKSIPYKVLKAGGEGFYVGMVLNQENARRGDWFKFLEGNTKFFVDSDDETPSLEYTGTEDIFQGAWYYIYGEFSAPYSGLTIRSLNNLGPIRTALFSKFLKNKVSQYRFHELDAIPFKESINIYIHHGEFDEIPTNQSSVAYFYAKKPVLVSMDTLKKGEFIDEYYK